jgi:hypothetical protein
VEIDGGEEVENGEGDGERATKRCIARGTERATERATERGVNGADVAWMSDDGAEEQKPEVEPEVALTLGGKKEKVRRKLEEKLGKKSEEEQRR